MPTNISPPVLEENDKTMLEQRRADFQRGFVAGVRSFAAWSEAEWLGSEEALKAFPDPPPKPREIVIDGLWYRCVDGVMQYRSALGQEWRKSTITKEGLAVSFEANKRLSDLLEYPLENPTS